MNSKQVEVFGGVMFRNLEQMPLENKMNKSLALTSLEDVHEFLFF